MLMSTWPEINIKLQSKMTSEIQQFFAHKVVLVTGGTGFLGKVLIEKLLRACPDLAIIFILVRSKRHQTPKERFSNFINDNVFKPLLSGNPDVFQKLELVEGDISHTNIGVNSLTWNRLIINVNVIFHVAAVVNFEEKLKNAILTNVCGVREILKLARHCQQLVSLVHVSTAFSFCHLKTIKEQNYPSPIDPELLMQFVDYFDESALNLICPKLISPWPNTYTFTKAVAENLIEANRGNLPIAIVRPSIVTATYQEPLKGWINNVYGPTGVVVGASYGILRVVLGNGKYVADIIPGDIVINGILAVAYRTSLQTIKGVQYFNMVSGRQNPITWNQFKYLNKAVILKYPPSTAVWSFHITDTGNHFVFYTLFYVLQVLPMMLADTVLKLNPRRFRKRTGLLGYYIRRIILLKK